MDSAETIKRTFYAAINSCGGISRNETPQVICPVYIAAAHGYCDLPKPQFDHVHFSSSADLAGKVNV